MTTQTNIGDQILLLDARIHLCIGGKHLWLTRITFLDPYEWRVGWFIGQDDSQVPEDDDFVGFGDRDVAAANRGIFTHPESRQAHVLSSLMAHLEKNGFSAEAIAEFRPALEFLVAFVPS